MDDADFDRVAYYDPTYQTGWVHDPPGIARILAQRHGFIILDAKRLASWMKSWAARDPSRTVCVMLQGLVPDTVAERKSRNCTARRYLDAGGRLVWVGDVPFYQVGLSDGSRKEWGNVGHSLVLGVEHAWGNSGATAVTEEGRRWGLELTDTGERCSPVNEVTPLRTITAAHGGPPLAATWHKVYDPRHPLQGFLRYRGGSFDHVNWNAKVNELARAALRGFEEPFRAPDSWRDEKAAAAARVVFSDPRYPAKWSDNPQAASARLASAHGFAPRDADELRTWMRAQVAGGAAGSVCVILHGAAPDTVFDDLSPQCLARRYLDAGGRLAWAGDVPFYYRGRADGESGYRNDAGTHEAVLDIPLRWDWEMPGPPSVTEAGKAWGLTTADEALRCVDASCVSEVLAGTGPFASSWLKTYAPGVPGSGFLRFRGGPFKAAMADELAAAALHGLPERAAAAAGGAGASEPEGERAGGGAFVVDRGRALEKLMKFMLPAPELFLQPLARVAAASGARTFSLEKDGSDVVVWFDGSPLPSEAVHDPFAAVTAESPDPRLRAWGLAVLTALRSEPREIRLTSGEGKDNASATVRSVEKVVAGPAAAERGTLFRIVSPEARLPPLAELKASLAARAPAFAGGLLPRGKGRRVAPAELSFDDGKVRGTLRVPSEPLVASNLLVCVQGVGAATVSFVLRGAAQVEGWVNDDRLGLNASLNGIVRDERLHAVREALSARLPRLVRVAAARLRRLSAGRADRLSKPGMGALWARRTGAAGQGRLAEAWGAVARAAVPDEAEGLLEDEARLVVWLREAASGLLSSLEADASDPLKAALWKAPLFTSVEGSPLSLAAMELARRVDGRVPFATKLGNARADGRLTAWAPEKKESDVLRRYFGEAVRPQTAAARRLGGGVGGALERAGLTDILVRVPIDGGEAGLRLQPDSPGVRVRGLKGGQPDSFHHKVHRFRIDAAVEGPADAKAEAAAFAAADRLYRLLASSFSCPVSFGWKGAILKAFKGRRGVPPLERERAALSHLRDYLGTTVAADGARWPRSIPLYESTAGWESYDALVADLERERILLWLEPGANGTPTRLGLDALLGRAEGDARMPELFKGLERHVLEPWHAVAWVKAPPRLNCAHQAPFGCLAQGDVEGASVHLAVSPKGEALLYPNPSGDPRSVSLESVGALAYEAALAAVLRAPLCLGGGGHPWKAFVLAVAAREFSPWPGRPGTGALRALLSARLTFRYQWGWAGLATLQGALSGDAPVVYTPPGGPFDPARYALSPEELGFLKALWPDKADRLMTAEEFARFNKTMALEGAWTPETMARARARARPDGPRPAPPRGALADPLLGTRDLLAEIGASSGSWTAASQLGIGRLKGKALVAEAGLGRLCVDVAHRTARVVLESALPAGVKAAYLASSVHSTVNRQRRNLTDKDDAEFQAALAAWAADEP